MKKTLSLTIIVLCITLNLMAQEDKYIYLEDVDGKKALEFVEKQNKATFDVLLNRKEYPEIYQNTLNIVNATDRIAYPTVNGNFIYNFWQDKTNERGIWRKTTKENFNSKNVTWETVLDIDALSKKDNIKWVFKGARGLYPDYNKFLISLSKGGGDAVVVKEFDATTKTFVENGFSVPEAKSNVSYLDANTIIIGSDFGAGTMTDSGYPRQVKLWSRGTDLKNAKLVYEGDKTDVSVSGYNILDGKNNFFIINKGTTFYTSKKLLSINNKLITIDIPNDADIATIMNNQLIVTLKSDWLVNNKTYKQGSVVSLNFDLLINDKKEIKTIFEPSATNSVEGISTTKNFLILNVLNNVKSELYNYSLVKGKWIQSKIKTQDFGTISIVGTDEFTDDYYYDYQNFITPTSLYYSNAKTQKTELVKALPSYFDASKFSVNQYKAKSKDGEMIPYFVVAAKNIKLDGTNPTLLNAYGGFEVSRVPTYSGALGKVWLENSGVYVLANIRGGGEFGPKWHQAGLKEKRQNIYNDFHAVAEDLIAKKITSSKNLGIMGGSNGGLLMGVALTQRPDLYNAVVCQVPLLDMKRYNKLLAGASWMGEYGDPDTTDWEFIKKYSPYQNLRENTKYPEVFFMTSTRDDRVHPGHARKMAAKMLEMGNKIYYYENTEGGHGGASTNEQRAKFNSLYMTYLFMKLKS